MFFNGWEILARTLIVGVLSYAALVFLLLMSGKRTLSKMNVFDFVITIALGSTFASILTSPNVALAEGVLALATLIGLQFLITWLSSRSRFVSNLVKLEPTMVFYLGSFLQTAMKEQRVTKSEIRQAVREKGITTMNEVEAVVLETNGELSVLKRRRQSDQSAMENVANWEQPTA